MEQTRTRSVINNLTEGPIVKQLVLYTLPIVASNLLQALYTLVDLWIVGNFSSTAVISAVSISGQIIYILHCIGMGIGSGGQILISQQVGAKDYKKLNTTIGTMLSFCAISSIVMVAVGVLGCNLWVSLMQTPEEAVTPSVNYLLICCIGVPFVYVGGTLCSILRGIGNSRIPMFIMGTSTVVNIILDFVFVAIFGWGAAGAAAATSIAQIVSFVYGLAAVYRLREGIGFDFKPKSFLIDVPIMKVLLRLSAPLIALNTCVTFSMMVITGLVNTAGLAASAVTGIGSKVNQMISVITSSISTAVGAMGAQNFAAGKFDRVRKINRYCNLFCIAVMIVLGLFMWFFPTQIIGVFTSASNTDVLALAPLYIHINLIGYCANFLMATPGGHINAVGFTSLNLVIALIDAAARIAIAFLMGNVMGLGISGYWLGNSLAPYITVILSFAYYFFGNWEKRKPLTEPAL